MGVVRRDGEHEGEGFHRDGESEGRASIIWFK